MTMKILNRFIDDCVNVFQYRFMDTFQYFKERNKNKYLGDRFEEWVVKNSNISKDGCSDLDTGKYSGGFWIGEVINMLRDTGLCLLHLRICYWNVL